MPDPALFLPALVAAVGDGIYAVKRKVGAKATAQLSKDLLLGAGVAASRLTWPSRPVRLSPRSRLPAVRPRERHCPTKVCRSAPDTGVFFFPSLGGVWYEEAEPEEQVVRPEEDVTEDQLAVSSRGQPPLPQRHLKGRSCRSCSS